MSKVLQSFVSTNSVQLLDGIKASQDNKTSHHSPIKPRKKMKRANSEQVVQFQSNHADKKEPLDVITNGRNHHEKLPSIHKADILT